jgi:hypothetical protein
MNYFNEGAKSLGKGAVIETLSTRFLRKEKHAKVGVWGVPVPNDPSRRPKGEWKTTPAAARQRKRAAYHPNVRMPAERMVLQGSMFTAIFSHSPSSRKANRGCLTGVKKRTGAMYLIEEYGRHEETRTPDLYRVKVAL